MVAVLMSTYNGEKYLREQIDSILNQSFKDWILYVRDDGSSDKTASIVREYEKLHPNQISFIQGENIGCGFSFMQLLEIVDADYYMFCDQDDVWMNDKVEKTFKKMIEMENLYGEYTAIGIFTDLCVVDQNLSVKHDSFWVSNRRNPDDAKHLYHAIVNRQPFLGCTMMMNKAVKREVFPITGFVKRNGYHDNWVMFNLIVKGKVDYVNEPLILYRQHENNVSGYEALTLSHQEVYKSLITAPMTVIKQICDRYKDLKLLPFKISFVKFVYYWVVKWIK